VTRPRTGFPFLDAGLDQPGSVLAFAHRGGAYHPDIEGLENTVAAFQHAVDLGYRYLETDARATRDGALIAIHDAQLDRVTEERGSIGELDHAEVAAALIAGREEIPTLQSLFERFPEVCFNIDIKSEAAIRPLVELIRSMNAYDRVCVAAFSDRRMRTFRRLMPRPVATASGPVEVAVTRFLPGRLPVDVLARGQAAVLQVPHHFRGLRVPTERLLAQAHAAGRQVHVWTVDDPRRMTELLDLGVDGLMTDRTDLLRDVLIRRGQWMGDPR
jgi:glycerophosphoryl diester phosphodiesterase